MDIRKHWDSLDKVIFLATINSYRRFILDIFFIFYFNLFFFIPIYSFDFTKDHSFHKDFGVEWCYFVGHLVAQDGEEIGYEFSFFKGQIMGKEEVFPVHFAISLTQQKKHFTAQTVERRIGKLADYDFQKIYAGDYKLEILSPTHFQISANPRNSSIYLELKLKVNSTNDIILQGDTNGYSLKSRKFPVFSYYYSIPRLQTTGKIRVENQTYTIISGNTWMDHEWSEPEGSETTLSSKENSWDWICLNLDDGSDLMVFNFQHSVNSPKETFGTYRKANGEIIYFDKENEIRLFPGNKNWKSPITKKVYNLEWKIESSYFQLHVQDVFPNQEFIGYATTGNSYWEGQISATGKIGSQTVTGKGYLELKGK